MPVPERSKATSRIIEELGTLPEGGMIPTLELIDISGVGKPKIYACIGSARRYLARAGVHFHSVPTDGYRRMRPGDPAELYPTANKKVERALKRQAKIFADEKPDRLSKEQTNTLNYLVLHNNHALQFLNTKALVKDVEMIKDDGAARLQAVMDSLNQQKILHDLPPQRTSS